LSERGKAWVALLVTERVAYCFYTVILKPIFAALHTVFTGSTNDSDESRMKCILLRLFAWQRSSHSATRLQFRLKDAKERTEQRKQQRAAVKRPASTAIK